ncbi:MAG: hypothetical protein HUJ62_06420, partial [Streptococcus gallolyticus]|nr:hypothetical protein [Streptococcus gallolyticus]
EKSTDEGEEKADAEDVEKQKLQIRFEGTKQFFNEGESNVAKSDYQDFEVGNEQTLVNDVSVPKSFTLMNNSEENWYGDYVDINEKRFYVRKVLKPGEFCTLDYNQDSAAYNISINTSDVDMSNAWGDLSFRLYGKDSSGNDAVVNTSLLKLTDKSTLANGSELKSPEIVGNDSYKYYYSSNVILTDISKVEVVTWNNAGNIPLDSVNIDSYYRNNQTKQIQYLNKSFSYGKWFDSKAVLSSTDSVLDMYFGTSNDQASNIDSNINFDIKYLSEISSDTEEKQYKEGNLYSIEPTINTAKGNVSHLKLALDVNISEIQSISVKVSANSEWKLDYINCNDKAVYVYDTITADNSPYLVEFSKASEGHHYKLEVKANKVNSTGNSEFQLTPSGQVFSKKLNEDTQQVEYTTEEAELSNFSLDLASSNDEGVLEISGVYPLNITSMSSVLAVAPLSSNLGIEYIKIYKDDYLLS